MRKIRHVIWALLCTICFPIWISDTTLAFSNSIFSVALFAALARLFGCAASRPCDSRMRRYTTALGFLFSAMTASGYALEKTGYVPYNDVKLLIAVFLYTYAFSALLCVVWKKLERISAFLSEALSRKSVPGRIECVVKGLLEHPAAAALFIFACWLPCYMAIFPGNFVYDATAEYYQMITGYDGDFPMLHSALIVRLIAYANMLTGSHNTGIAIYVIMQMILLALLFAYMLCDLHRLGINRLLLGAVLLYYAAFPVIAMLATCTVRDVMFGGLLTYVVFLLYVLCRDREAFFSARFMPAALGTALVLTFFSRNSHASPMITIVFGGGSLLLSRMAGKENRRGRNMFLGTMIGCWAFLGITLPFLCRPMNPPTAGAALSLMTQSISRAYIEEPETWTEQEREAFGRFFKNAERIAYVPKNADRTKLNYIGKEEEFGEFLKLWAAIGKKHPGCYLDAVLANTRQMWFPNCVIDGYMHLHDNPEDLKRYEKSYFEFGDAIEVPGELQSLLPKAHVYYNQIAQKISFEKIPVVSMLFSIGFQFWLLLNGCFFVAYKRIRTLYMPLAVLLIYMLVCACAPLVLVRYYCVIFFAIPLVMVFTLQPETAAGIKRV